MWKNYFKIGFRNLLKNKTYTGINLLGLTVGVAASIMLFFYIQLQLSFDNFHKNGNAVYRILNTRQEGDQVFRTPSMPLALKPVLEGNFAQEMVFTNILPQNFLAKVEDGEGFNQDVMMVSPGFFDMFSFRMLQGQAPKSSENRYDIVLTESAAKKYFGDANPIGKSLLIRPAEDFISYHVVGVMEDVPANSSLVFELLMLDDNADLLYTQQQRDHWYMAFGDAYLMVKNPDNAAGFEKSMQQYIHGLFQNREEPIDYNFALQPLADVYFSEESGTAANMNPRILWILGGIAVLIILIACINFTTMAIGNSSSRAKEVGVRKTMGAGTDQLFGQFMAESILMTLFSLGLGLGLARVFLPTFNQLMETRMEISLSSGQLLLILVFGVLIALVAGSYPAVFLASFRPIQVLKSNLSLKFGKQGLRLSLLGFQFFISIFLITCTLIMYKQMKTIEDHELGINQTAVLQINVPPPAAQGLGQLIDKGFEYGQTFKNELIKMPEVENVSVATAIFGDNTWFNAGYESPDGKEIEFKINIVDEEFVTLFGLELIEGRNFSANIPADKSTGIIINEAMKTALGWDDVVGNSLESKRGFPENKAVGMVKDFHYESLYRKVDPGILVLHHGHIFPGVHSLWMSENMVPKIFVKIQSNDLQQTVEKLRAKWQDIYGTDPFNYSFLEDNIANQYTKDQSLRTLVSAAALIAVIIAGMGLFAMASLAISSRIKEIGIRKVLGATTMEISMLFNKDFLKITMIGILAALPASYYLMRQWLNDFAVKTNLGLGVFLLAVGVGLVFSVLIVSSQTVKASWLNPVKNLRSE